MPADAYSRSSLTDKGITMEASQDPVAGGVAADFDHLAQHGAMQLCGYVRLTQVAVQKRGVDGELLPGYDLKGAMRVYVNMSFAHWIEVPGTSVLYQLPPRPEEDGRSLIWIDADAVVTRSQSLEAGDLAQALVGSGSDDPTAYPRRRPRGGGG